MTHADFRKLMHRRFVLTSRVLDAKSAEYATDDDKLHNFKAAAKLEGCTAIQALRGMLIKHWVSIQDIVNRIEDKDIWAAPAVLDERIGDAINFLILLEALLVEGRNSSEKREAELSEKKRLTDDKMKMTFAEFSSWAAACKEEARSRVVMLEAYEDALSPNWVSHKLPQR